MCFSMLTKVTLFKEPILLKALIENSYSADMCNPLIKTLYIIRFKVKINIINYLLVNN